jgi:hypothetical protein
MDGTEALPSALAAATDEAIVGAIVQLGDDRLSLISRQLSRHAAAAQAKRSSATRRARLLGEIVSLLELQATGLRRHQLSRQLRRPISELDEALETLVYLGRVRVEKKQEARGRPAQRYVLR